MKKEISSILEGLQNEEITQYGKVNESSKPVKYPFETNLSKERLKSCKKFLSKVDAFYKSILPKMDAKMKMGLDLSELVGEGIVANLYIWGYNDLVEDEYEFDRLYNKKDMCKQVGGIVKSSIGTYTDCFASDYWNSKIEINNKQIRVGPNVCVTFKDIED